MLKKTFFIFILLNYAIIAGCVGIPKNQDDACSIINQKKSWRSALKKTERKWGVSPGMQLSFIKTESNFRPTARTQRKYFLGLIPSGRISSAYGYSQALDGTWKEYKRSTENKYHRRYLKMSQYFPLSKKRLTTRRAPFLYIQSGIHQHKYGKNILIKNNN